MIEPLTRYTSCPTIAEDSKDDEALTAGQTSLSLSSELPCVFGKRIHIVVQTTGALTDLVLRFTAGYGQMTADVALGVPVGAGTTAITLYAGGMGQTVELRATKASGTTGAATAWIAVLS